jgi:site-specific recombinase XerD
VPGRRGAVRAELGVLAPYVESFALCLKISEREPRTIEMYVDAVRWFAGWLLDNRAARRWDQVTSEELRAFFLHMHDLNYQQSYRNNIGRCLQAFFKWFSEEEERPNPFSRFKPPPPPKIGEKQVPVLSMEDMGRLVRDAESGRDFEARRDAALLRMFASTGCRLSEISKLRLGDVDVRARTATVTGKGNKTRTVKFDHKCALALDRYLRKRAEHPAAELGALWIGTRRRQGMTPSGVRQVIERRGERLGLDIHPHVFRHTFSHNWLDGGGAEGDLMELNGWESPQMLRHYGASARAARARRAYDRVNVMGDV